MLSNSAGGMAEAAVGDINILYDERESHLCNLQFGPMEVLPFRVQRLMPYMYLIREEEKKEAFFSPLWLEN
jgi:hypothetical protein